MTQQMGQQNQQSKQGSMMGQGAQFSDRDMLQVALNESKLMADALNTGIIEASGDQLRRDYMTVLGEMYSQQKQIFDTMQQKGYYNIKNASPQDVSQAKSKFSGSKLSM